MCQGTDCLHTLRQDYKDKEHPHGMVLQSAQQQGEKWNENCHLDIYPGIVGTRAKTAISGQSSCHVKERLSGMYRLMPEHQQENNQLTQQEWPHYSIPNLPEVDRTMDKSFFVGVKNLNYDENGNCRGTPEEECRIVHNIRCQTMVQNDTDYTKPLQKVNERVVPLPLEGECVDDCRFHRFRFYALQRYKKK